MPDQTQPLTAAQAQELAQNFHDIAAAIGQYRLVQVTVLTPTQQYQLQNIQLQCIQYSNTFISAGLFAAQSNLATTLASIKQATVQANQAIATIKDVDKALQIATAAAVLGASIASMNPSAVGNGLDGLVKAVAGSTTAASGSTTSTSGAAPSSTP
jgi:hypothetical protein